MLVTLLAVAALGAPTLLEGALLVGHALLMLGVCLLAGVVPARRALRVQPMEAWRVDLKRAEAPRATVRRGGLGASLRRMPPSKVLLQHLLPKHALTALAGRFANARAGALTTAVIRWFVGRYGVNMAEAAEPDVAAYATFNDFFTRALRPGARPLAAAELICPVDGAISQLGAIEGGQVFQAKGHSYSTSALLGGDAELAESFRNGQFATLYLSPRDYHRIHMPCDGRLRRMVHVPGALFSVNPTTARGVRGLFARNERVVCVFDGGRGRFVMVLVGATIVGSMATVWHGVVNPPRPGTVREWRYDDREVVLRKGEEMGRFLLGSTVVLLFPASCMRFTPSWGAERAIRMGEAMGAYR